MELEESGDWVLEEKGDFTLQEGVDSSTEEKGVLGTEEKGDLGEGDELPVGLPGDSLEAFLILANKISFPWLVLQDRGVHEEGVINVFN